VARIPFSTLKSSLDSGGVSSYIPTCSFVAGLNSAWSHCDDRITVVVHALQIDLLTCKTLLLHCLIE